MKIRNFNDYISINEMKIDFLNKVYNLREFPSYTAIPHNKSSACDECGYANFLRPTTYDIVGFCSTPVGYMGVFECLKCGELYRHHISPDKFDLDNFKEMAGMILNRQSKRTMMI